MNLSKQEERPGKAVARESIIMKNRAWEWWFSLVLFALLFLFVLEYHRWRSKPYSLFTANKAIAISSALLFSLALALGPIHRLTGWFSRRLGLRRCLGLTGAFFMGVHLLLSLFVVERFDLAYYLEKWPAWVFGATALAGFLFMWMTSYPRFLARLGRERWKRAHMLSYLFLAMIVLHIISLGKMPNWIKWCEIRDHPVPPGTTIPSTVILLVLLLKLADWSINRRKGVT
jgi:DMSO/TMAO reductase YedYZ heme-binding membrane subunit